MPTVLLGSLTLIGASIGVLLLTGLIIAAILAFEIWMFVDLLNNSAIPSDQKILWAIGMLLVHPLAAIIYFLTARNTQH